MAGAIEEFEAVLGKTLPEDVARVTLGSSYLGGAESVCVLAAHPAPLNSDIGSFRRRRVRQTPGAGAQGQARCGAAAELVGWVGLGGPALDSRQVGGSDRCLADCLEIDIGGLRG